MSFFVKFLTGSLVGGGLTLYYQADIRRTTEQLTTDLHKLSDQLVRAAPTAEPSIAPPSTQGPVIPQRLPFTEELKARWNEQLGGLIHSAQTTDWSSVASRAYTSLRSTLAAAQAQSAAPATVGASAGPETEAGQVAGGPQGVGAAEVRSEEIPVARAVEAKPLAVKEGKRWV
ncbi:hypothetical protein JCM10450v2_001738 [Rhodotorula kratochvilovae]